MRRRGGWPRRKVPQWRDTPFLRRKNQADGRECTVWWRCWRGWRWTWLERSSVFNTIIYYLRANVTKSARVLLPGFGQAFAHLVTPFPPIERRRWWCYPRKLWSQICSGPVTSQWRLMKITRHNRSLSDAWAYDWGGVSWTNQVLGLIWSQINGDTENQQMQKSKDESLYETALRKKYKISAWCETSLRGVTFESDELEQRFSICRREAVWWLRPARSLDAPPSRPPWCKLAQNSSLNKINGS